MWKKSIINKKNRKTIKPYGEKKYNLFLSYLKELYLIYKILLFYLKEIFFTKRKSILIFERSLRDIIIDPSRYRLKHYPKLINHILNMILKNSNIYYLNVSFKLSKKRKNEITYKKFLELEKNIKKYFLQNTTINPKKLIKLKS